MPRFTDPKLIAPTPPNGPTTYATFAAMIVGVILAALSLFDVVPTDEDVQALGVIVGAVLVVVPYIVSAISRTKQANNLAKLAQGERIAERNANPRLVAGRGGLQPGDAVVLSSPTPAPTPETLGLKSMIVDGPSGEPLLVYADHDVVAAVTDFRDEAAAGTLGAPESAYDEVPGGGPRPGEHGPVESAAEVAARVAFGTTSKATP